eukprot:2214216-Rhodomonas_salina.1
MHGRMRDPTRNSRLGDPRPFSLSDVGAFSTTSTGCPSIADEDEASSTSIQPGAPTSSSPCASSPSASASQLRLRCAGLASPAPSPSSLDAAGPAASARRLAASAALRGLRARIGASLASLHDGDARAAE